MDLLQEYQLITTCHWSDIPVKCDGQYLAWLSSQTVVTLSRLDDPSEQVNSLQPIELAGHHKKINAICFGWCVFPRLLCSASEDYLIIWDIPGVVRCYETGETIRGKIVGTSPGPCQCITFSPDDSTLAVGVSNDIIIISSKSEQLLATLEGHMALVTAVEYCPHYGSTLISISEDRTFKVWNTSEFSLVYQSTIVSASPFITMAMNPNKEQVAIGTMDGHLRVYDLSDKNDFRCLHHLDASRVVTKLIQNQIENEKSVKEGPIKVSSHPSWKRETTALDPEPLPTENEAELGCAILSLSYTQQRKPEQVDEDCPSILQRENTAIRDILSAAPMLVVATATGLLQVNAFTLEICSFRSFLNAIPCVNSSTQLTLPPVGSIHLHTQSYQKMWCIVGSLFQNQLHVLSWRSPAIPQGETTQCKNSTKIDTLDGLSAPEISFLSSKPLVENSILKAELVPKKKVDDKPRSGKGQSSIPKKNRSQSLTDQPLTFKPKVKSSGYSAAPRKMTFTPVTNASKGRSPCQKPSKTLSERISDRSYPVDSNPPINLLSCQGVADKPTSITCLQFTENGDNLACGLGNSTIQVFKLPLTGKGTCLTGHNSPVLSVHYSHTDQRLLSSSEDRTARVWVKGQPEPILVIDRTDNNLGKESTSGKENPLFSKDVRFGQFYYLNKFILLTSGNSMFMYKYHLDPTKDEIKRYLTKSRYKVVKRFQFEKMQTITELQSINSFCSYLTLVAGSDRSLSVLDMNVGQVCRTMEDVHSKPCHVIALNEGSTSVSHPEHAYDLFATAAMMDSIKLWDNRTNRCVRRYEGHQNRCYPCGLSLSPCGRFLATGSEDKAAYIYDLRSGTYLHKLTGHTDVISDVAFHPCKPQLVTACLDGKIRLFTDSVLKS